VIYPELKELPIFRIFLETSGVVGGREREREPRGGFRWRSLALLLPIDTRFRG